MATEKLLTEFCKFSKKSISKVISETLKFDTLISSCNRGASDGSRCFLMCQRGSRLVVRLKKIGLNNISHRKISEKQLKLLRVELFNFVFKLFRNNRP